MRAPLHRGEQQADLTLLQYARKVIVGHGTRARRNDMSSQRTAAVTMDGASSNSVGPDAVGGPGTGGGSSTRRSAIPARTPERSRGPRYSAAGGFRAWSAASMPVAHPQSSSNRRCNCS